MRKLKACIQFALGIFLTRHSQLSLQLHAVNIGYQRRKSFNTRYLLSCVIAFIQSVAHIFDALGINDAEPRFSIATLPGLGFANLIFLKPAQETGNHLH